MWRRAASTFGVLAGYCAISFLYFGRPLVAHPGRDLLGTPGQHDPEIFIWSFGWWPHAIGSWINPFVSHAIYEPQGINLTWSATAPGLALAFSPLTVLAGPTAAYNVAGVLLPALAAWTGYLLCRAVTGSLWASLVGGYLFGFSSYTIGHELAAHLNLNGVFLVPLVALVVIRYVRGELVGRGLAWRLGVLIAFQLTISTEITLTLTLMLALALLLAFAFVRDARSRLVAAVPPIVGAYAIAAVLAAPFVVYTLKGLNRDAFTGAQYFNGDLLNLFVPTHLIAAGGSALASVSRHFQGNDNERTSYLGIPVLIIIVLFAIRAWRWGVARFLLAGLALAAVLTIGTPLRVYGHRLIAFPWAVPARWPAFNNVLPERFALYASLAAAVVVALWTASTRGVLRYVLSVLAVASLVPAVWQVDFHQVPERWSFFSDGLYKTCIPRGETVAVFPFGRWGDAMLWQAESDFRFRMPEGNIGPSNLPPGFVSDPTVAELQFKFIDPDIRPTTRQLLAFARSHHVDRFVSVEVHAYPNGTQMHSFGAVQLVGGVLVSPACGYTSLTGDRRLVDPGQHDLAGRAVLEVALTARRTLVRACSAHGRAAADPLLARVSADLRLLESYDRTSRPLARATALAVPGSSCDRIGAARRALGAYAATLNAGVER